LGSSPVFLRHFFSGYSIKSLCEQTLKPSEFEVIIINNSPEEAHHLEFLLRLFRSKLRLIGTTAKRAVSYSARNTGVALAEGEVLAFLDSDCMAEPSCGKPPTKEVSKKSLPRLPDKTNWS
jgi:cellulose synthase/poly-beta-1,6-N-acetylglucosamine synthase-like glycosyltransferase